MRRYKGAISWAVLAGFILFPCTVFSASITETSAAIGKGCTAIGSYTTAMGCGSSAIGNSSTAMGFYATARGNFSTAIGYKATADGEYSTAMGFENTASGYASIATGRGSTAGKNYSTAMGYDTYAKGTASTAMGHSTSALGDYSFAIGKSSYAWADYSVAIGNDVQAVAGNSTAIGSSTMTGGYNSWVGGKLMHLGFGADYTFVWGHSENNDSPTIAAANAFLIFPPVLLAKLGLEQYRLNISWIWVVPLAEKLRCFQTPSGDDFYGFGIASGLLQIYAGANTEDEPAVVVRKISGPDGKIFGYLGIGTTSPDYALEVNGNAAKTSGGTTWINSSDVRLKDIAGEYQRGLEEIATLRPVTFFYKEDNPRGLPSNEENVGFVAQEVQDVFPEAVSEGPDGYLDFNMHPVNVAVINAIKELKKENDFLKAENAMLKKDIENINSAFAHF
jgi:hypothetical protein